MTERKIETGYRTDVGVDQGAPSCSGLTVEQGEVGVAQIVRPPDLPRVAYTLADLSSDERTWLKHFSGPMVPAEADGLSRPFESYVELPEAAGRAITSPRARGVLLALSERTFLSKEELQELASTFEDWRSIWQVVYAGWARDSDDGIMISPIGRRVARAVFDEGDRGSSR